MLTSPFVETNWAKGIDGRGEPIPSTEKEPKPDGTLVSPGSDGAANWMASSFDPSLGYFFVSARRQWSIFYMTAEGKPEGWAGRDRNLWSTSILEAIDYKTGKVAWRRDIGTGEGVAGILTTAGNVLFTADNNGNLIALEPATGKALWHVPLGEHMATAPSTYMLDGRQYLLTPVGNVMYAWTLSGKAR